MRSCCEKPVSGSHNQGLMSWLVLPDPHVEVDVTHWGFPKTRETVASFTWLMFEKKYL